ncbi:hypothetical protein ACU686_26485 [Yinghuangia aomiensis]
MRALLAPGPCGVGDPQRGEPVGARPQPGGCFGVLDGQSRRRRPYGGIHTIKERLR